MKQSARWTRWGLAGLLAGLWGLAGCPSKTETPATGSGEPPPSTTASPSGSGWGSSSGVGSTAGSVSSPTSPSEPTVVHGAPTTPNDVVKISAPASPELVATVFADVHDPAKVWAAAKSNAWLSEALESPLGRGFVGSWYGFFVSKGETMSAQFTGSVIDFMASKMLTDPFRVVWLGSDRRPGTPVVVVPSPGSPAKAALSTLSAVAQRGKLQADGCPGIDTETKTSVAIERWVIADRAVYVSEHNGRVVIGRYPGATLQGACLAPFDIPPAEGIDLEIGFVSKTFDRGVQSLSRALGFEDVPRLAFGIDGSTFAPRGILAKMSAERLLAPSGKAEALLDLVPESTPVFMTMALNLPNQVDLKSLTGLFNGELSGDRSPVQVAVLWNPRGSVRHEEELAVVWSRPKDEGALRNWFDQRPFSWGKACGHLVMSTSRRYFSKIQDACDKKIPSIRHADPTVAQGFSQASSVGLGVHFGRLTHRVFWDAYRAERRKKARPPQEIEAASTALEALPFFGWTGTVKGEALVGGGFRS